MNKIIRSLSLTSAGFLLTFNTAFANPENPTVAHGNATFTQQGQMLSVTNSVGAIINWQEFSIAQDEITRFIQQNASSAVLNRVTGGNLSQILGQLQSNGRVFLINPAGIVFGENALIDTNGLVASTLNLSDESFKSGTYEFSGDGGALINRGNIHVTGAGDVILLASSIENSGLIQTDDGDIMLGAGNSVSVSYADQDHISFVVEGNDNELVNLGQVAAGGGNAALHGGSILQRGGVQLVESADGRILLEAQDKVVVSGDVSASGGEIRILADEIVLQGADISTSGDAGGGEILIGGDLQGGNGVRTAALTSIDSQTVISADALVAGDAGRVIVWSDELTEFNGRITARGGELGGNGGFVETSSMGVLQVSGEVSILAPLGDPGDWLLDPEDIVIDESMATSIESTLNEGGHVTVKTADDGTGEGNITVASSITKTSGEDASLTLDAHNNIDVDAPITSESNKLDVNLKAGNSINVNATITTNGGNLTQTIVASVDPAPSEEDSLSEPEQNDPTDESEGSEEELAQDSETESSTEESSETVAEESSEVTDESESEQTETDAEVAEVPESAEPNEETTGDVAESSDTQEPTNPESTEETDSTEAPAEGTGESETEVVAEEPVNEELADPVDETEVSELEQAASEVSGSVIVVNAALVTSGGDIVLDASETGSLLIGDDVDSSDMSEGATGGDITLLGENVGLFDDAEVDASGDDGGGTILIGGEQQGGGDTPTSEIVYVGEDASVSSDGGTTGDGGTVILYSDHTTRVYGDISATGGTESGDGGFVETSGRQSFDLPKNPDVSASNGENGTWLIDPIDVTISAAADFNTLPFNDVVFLLGDDAVLNVDTLRDALLAGNVTITTVGTSGNGEGDILWEGNLELQNEFMARFIGFGELTLDSADDIIITGTIITDNDITLNAVDQVQIGAPGSTGDAKVLVLNSDRFLSCCGGLPGGVITVDADDFLIYSDLDEPTLFGTRIGFSDVRGTFGGAFGGSTTASAGIDIDLTGDFSILYDNGGDVELSFAISDNLSTIDVGGNFLIDADSTASNEFVNFSWLAQSDMTINVGGNFTANAVGDSFFSLFHFGNNDQQFNTFDTFLLDVAGDITLDSRDGSYLAFEMFDVGTATVRAGNDIKLMSSGFATTEFAHIWQRTNEPSHFVLEAGNDLDLVAVADGSVIANPRQLFNGVDNYLVDIIVGNDMVFEAGNELGAGYVDFYIEAPGIFNLDVGRDLLMNSAAPVPAPGAETESNYIGLYTSAATSDFDPRSALEIDVVRDIVVRGHDGGTDSVFIANESGGDLIINAGGDISMMGEIDPITNDANILSGGITLLGTGAIDITAGGSVTLQGGTHPDSQISFSSRDVSVIAQGIAAGSTGDLIWDTNLVLDEQPRFFNDPGGLFDFEPLLLQSANDMTITGSIITDNDITLDAGGRLQLGVGRPDINRVQLGQIISVDSGFAGATNTGGSISITADSLDVLQDDRFDSSDHAHIATAAPRFSGFFDADPANSHVEINVTNDFTIGFEEQFARGITQILLGETDSMHTINVGGDLIFNADTLAVQSPINHLFTSEGNTDIQVGGDFIVEALGADTFATAEIADVFIGILGDQQPNPVSINSFMLGVAGNINFNADGERSNIVLETQNIPQISMSAGGDFNITSDNGSLVDVPSLWQRDDTSATLALDVGGDLNVIAANNGFAIIDPQNLSGQSDNYAFTVTTGNNLTLASQNVNDGSFSDAEIALSGGGIFDVNVGNDLLINPDPPIATLAAANDSNYVALNRFGSSDPGNVMNIDVLGNILINGYDQTGLSTFVANESGGDLNITAGGNIDILAGNDFAGSVLVFADGTVNIEAGGDFTLAGGNVVDSNAIIESQSLNTINVNAANISILSNGGQGQMNVLDAAPGSIVNLVSAGLCINCVVEAALGGPGVVVERLNVTAAPPPPPLPPVVPPVEPPIEPPVVVEVTPEVPAPVEVPVEPPFFAPEPEDPELPEDVINDVLASADDVIDSDENEDRDEEDQEEDDSQQCR